MSMMHSATALIMLMAFLIVVAGGIVLGVRLMGAHEVESDHPTRPQPPK